MLSRHCVFIIIVVPGWGIRQFRERSRFLNASTENLHRSRRAKRARAQTFYPCPPPSESEHHHHHHHRSSLSTESTNSSSSASDTDDSEDDAFSIDSSGYINTLVRDETILLLACFFLISIKDKLLYSASGRHGIQMERIHRLN